jgi:hypothetical protein
MRLNVRTFAWLAGLLWHAIVSDARRTVRRRRLGWR